MKTLSANSPAARLIASRRGARSGFTLIEIAISLAVLAFAMVAVIGVLPSGLTVQKDNREKTIVNEDARLIMDAMRQGNEGLYALTNHVEALFVQLTNNNASQTYVYTFASEPPPITLSAWLNPPRSTLITLGTNNPQFDLAVLSSPRGTAFRNGAYFFRSQALMRSMSGAFTEQAEMRVDEARNSDLSFRYLLTVEVSPYQGFSYPDIADANVTPITPEVLQARNRARQLGVLTNELHEVRLLFQWPVLPGGKLGNNRQSFRTLLTGVPRARVFTNYYPAGTFYSLQSQKYQMLYYQ